MILQNADWHRLSLLLFVISAPVAVIHAIAQLVMDYRHKGGDDGREMQGCKTIGPASALFELVQRDSGVMSRQRLQSGDW